jgi:hypothetical protein
MDRSKLVLNRTHKILVCAVDANTLDKKERNKEELEALLDILTA